MLPYPSGSSWAIVALLLRWAVVSPRQGGLVNPRHKQSAEDMLCELLRIVYPTPGSSVSIQLELVSEWVPTWPRPVHKGRYLPLELTSSGEVVVDVFLQRLWAEAATLPKGCWRGPHLEKLGRRLGARASLLSLMTFCSLEDKLHPLFSQLLWYVGSSLQDELLRASRGCSSRVVVAMSKASDELGANTTMDRSLVAYMHCGRELCRDLEYLTLATDKASVCGLGSGVQSTIFVLPTSNHAIVAAPQAEVLSSNQGSVRPTSGLRGSWAEPPASIHGTTQIASRIASRDRFFRVLTHFCHHMMRSGPCPWRLWPGVRIR